MSYEESYTQYVGIQSLLNSLSILDYDCSEYADSLDEYYSLQEVLFGKTTLHPLQELIYG